MLFGRTLEGVPVTTLGGRKVERLEGRWEWKVRPGRGLVAGGAVHFNIKPRAGSVLATRGVGNYGGWHRGNGGSVTGH